MKNVTNIKEFNEKGFIVIKNPFADEAVDTVYDWFSKDMPLEWWYRSHHPHDYAKDMNIDSGNSQFIPNYGAYNHLNTVMYNIAKNSMYNEEFSYSFHRTCNDHVKDCACTECGLRKLLESEQMIKFIKENTGKDISKAHELFASWYKKGDFLTTHTDDVNGKVGFVFNLTKDWIPEYGGLLHIIDDNEVKKVILPKFGYITLFDVEKNKSPHFVSEVVVDGIKRLAYTGWYE